MSISSLFEVIADKVYKKGKLDNQSDFWNVFQNNGGGIANYQYAFAYGHWSDANYNPKYTIVATYSVSYMYYRATLITDTKVDINVRQATASSNVFNGASGLKTIRKIIVTENNTYVGWFTGCSALEKITFEGVIGNDISFEDCPLLTVDSMLNIISCLKNFTGTSTTKTLVLGSKNIAKLSDEAKQAITDKGWTIA